MLLHPPKPTLFPYTTLFRSMRLTAHRPKILKLHGDYLYSALKNTGRELTAQDPNMARQFRQVLSEYGDRKSTRLNSSHRCISYAVFCLKKKRTIAQRR